MTALAVLAAAAAAAAVQRPRLVALNCGNNSSRKNRCKQRRALWPQQQQQQQVQQQEEEVVVEAADVEEEQPVQQVRPSHSPGASASASWPSSVVCTASRTQPATFIPRRCVVPPLGHADLQRRWTGGYFAACASVI
jgi:hypothetical protein